MKKNQNQELLEALNLLKLRLKDYEITCSFLRNELGKQIYENKENLDFFLKELQEQKIEISQLKELVVNHISEENTYLKDAVK